MWTLTPGPRQNACIKAMPREFDQSVCVAATAQAVVVRSCAPGKGFEGSAKRRTTYRIEKSFDEHCTALRDVHLDGAVFDVPALLSLECSDIMSVAHVSAVIAKTAEVVRQRQVEKRRLLKRRRGWRLAEGTCGTGHEREVGEPEFPRLNRGVALREDARLVADNDGAGRCRTGHPAMATQPLRRTAAPLPLLLVGIGKSRGNRGELQLDAIDRSSQTHQVVAHDLRR